MIIKVKNCAEYDQPITLHTGEAKTIQAGAFIKINTGTDRRLMSFYASLVNYDFEVTSLEASGQELNLFQDALNKMTVIKKVSENNQGMQSKNIFPDEVKVDGVMPVEPKVEATQVLADKKPKDMVVNKVPKETYETQVPKIIKNPVVLDTKLGEPLPDYSQELPSDYPDLPAAVAEEKRLEAEEAKKNESDAKWYKLNELDDETLKRILLEKFEETTKLRSKSKIIYHIMELAEDSDISVYELVEEYR